MFSDLSNSLQRVLPSNRRKRTTPNGRLPYRPGLVVLEDRLVLSTLTVTSSADDVTQNHTLRYAVAHAHSGDTILLTAAIKSPIVLTNGELLLSQNVTIESVPGKTPSISGDGLSRVFEISAGASVNLINLNIIDGNGIANNPDGAPTDEGNGGGILNYGTLTVSGCTLSGNTATANAANGYYDFGGAIFSNNGALTIIGSTLSSNTAVNGGGISEFGAVTVIGCTFLNDIGTQVGGGLTVSGTVTVTGSTFAGNSTAYVGGGIFFFSGTLTVIGSKLSGNTAADGYGNGIGGGIYGNGTLTVIGSFLSGNTAGASGGAIENDLGILSIGTSGFSENTPDNVHGGYTDLGGNALH